jgi:hypothetical protein
VVSKEELAKCRGSGKIREDFAATQFILGAGYTI